MKLWYKLCMQCIHHANIMMWIPCDSFYRSVWQPYLLTKWRCFNVETTPYFNLGTMLKWGCFWKLKQHQDFNVERSEFLPFINQLQDFNVETSGSLPHINQGQDFHLSWTSYQPRRGFLPHELLLILELTCLHCAVQLENKQCPQISQVWQRPG